MTICPGCNKVNDLADDIGHVDGPREWHAECWQKQTKRDEFNAKLKAKLVEKTGIDPDRLIVM